MSRTLELHDWTMRRTARATAAIRVVACGLNALIVEHSRALLAATNATLPRRRLEDLRAMYTADHYRSGNLPFRTCHEAAIQGQLLRLSERREAAIYLRNDALWVADFIDGHGELADAATWFRFHCGTPTTWHARRRMVLESAIPLSAQLVARIEYLHRSTVAPPSGAAVRPVEPAAKCGRRGRLARIFLTPFDRRWHDDGSSGCGPV